MSKLIKITAIILGASMIFISSPYSTEAAKKCEAKKLEKTEIIVGEKSITLNKYYSQK